jgi:hypothetical protein
LNVPAVELVVRLSEIVADPALSGVTVTVWPSPQLENVMLVGDTVATNELLVFTPTTRVLDPVRLHPGFPSPDCGITFSVVVPVTPPAVSAMLSAAASTVMSRLFEMSSAEACGAASDTTPSTKAEPTSFRSE